MLKDSAAGIYWKKKKKGSNKSSQKVSRKRKAKWQFGHGRKRRFLEDEYEKV